MNVPEGFEVVGHASQWGVHWRVAAAWCGVLHWCRVPYPYALRWQVPMRYHGVVLAPKDYP